MFQNFLQIPNNHVFKCCSWIINSQEYLEMLTLIKLFKKIKKCSEVSKNIFKIRICLRFCEKIFEICCLSKKCQGLFQKKISFFVFFFVFYKIYSKISKNVLDIKFLFTYLKNVCASNFFRIFKIVLGLNICS